MTESLGKKIYGLVNWLLILYSVPRSAFLSYIEFLFRQYRKIDFKNISPETFHYHKPWLKDGTDSHVGVKEVSCKSSDFSRRKANVSSKCCKINFCLRRRIQEQGRWQDCSEMLSNLVCLKYKEKIFVRGKYWKDCYSYKNELEFKMSICTKKQLSRRHPN